MENLEETKRFLEKVDSIQRRFIESLVTGDRDPIFKEIEREHRTQPENICDQTNDNSARETA